MKNLLFILSLFCCFTGCEIDDDFTAPRVYNICESGEMLSPLERVDEVTVATQDLPTTVREYLASEFAGYDIQSASMFNTTSGKNYLAVVMHNEGVLLFDGGGNFICGDENFTRGDERDDEDNVNVEDLPEKILTYIADNYPGIEIYSAKYDDDEYEIELFNRIELYFNSDGNFLREER